MRKFQNDFKSEGSHSDKIGHHGYHRFYPWFLAHLREFDVNILEIGIDEHESLKLWKDYFNRPHIHGIDIDQKYFDDPDVTLHKLDQSNANELRKFVDTIGLTFDIILDDGSHVPAHQVLTINYLWSLLKPGGIYIIEDIETSYWKKSSIYGYRFNALKDGVMQSFRALVDVINSEFSGKDLQDTSALNFSREVEMVVFGQNCIILLKKDYHNFGRYYDRNYRLKKEINCRSKRRLLQKFFRKILFN